MSGIDENICLPICPKCNTQGTCYWIIMRTTSNYRTFDSIYGSVSLRHDELDEKINTFLIIGVDNIFGISSEDYVAMLKKRKGLPVYGFRCGRCDYLFSARRMKNHYQKLLDVIQNCLRRNQVLFERMRRWW